MPRVAAVVERARRFDGASAARFIMHFNWQVVDWLSLHFDHGRLLRGCSADAPAARLNAGVACFP